jgi:hypothetical protein
MKSIIRSELIEAYIEGYKLLVVGECVCLNYFHLDWLHVAYHKMLTKIPLVKGTKIQIAIDQICK